MPEQLAPLQPENWALAVNVMEVPLLNAAVQVAPLAPQSMPVGFDVTVPVPTNTTESIGRLKLAVTEESVVNVKVQAPVVPLHTAAFPMPLVQPVKLLALLGAAVTVIAVPTG